MAPDALFERARTCWSHLFGVLMEPGELRVVTNKMSAIAAPGWIGVVRLGDATAAVVPNAAAELPTELVPDELALRAGWVGPAVLFFHLGTTLTPPAGIAVTKVKSSSPALADLVARVSAEDAEESTITDIDSPAFVAMEGDTIVAAAGYEKWPGVGHICVLTDPAHRRKGYARAVATAAINEAIGKKLLVQWRARPPESQALARSLGLTELGWQVCWKPEV